MEITMIGRFEEACRHQGFCPAPYMTESMATRHCADGCCPDCGRFFQEEHPKAAERMKDMLVVWRVHT